jgi:hypothetical protein
LELAEKDIVPISVLVYLLCHVGPPFVDTYMFPTCGLATSVDPVESVAIDHQFAPDALFPVHMYGGEGGGGGRVVT